MGLFANSHFESGSVVCIYTGTRLATKEAIRIKDKSYLMRLGEQCYVDASSDPRIYARSILCFVCICVCIYDVLLGYVSACKVYF